MTAKEAIDLCASDPHQKWMVGDSDGVRADLSGADLRGANLSGANLSGANLSWANLSRANLSRANLIWADLRGATLCGATIDGAILSNEDIGGPGHILCALTDEEWKTISAGRTATVEGR